MKAEYWKERRQKLVANGICPRCQKPLDRQGTYCESCRQKYKEESKETYHKVIEIGICPRCRKNRIMGDEKSCPECRAIHTEKCAAICEQNRIQYREYDKNYKREKRKERKEKGLCPKCGKKITDKRYVTCERCRDKANNAYRATCQIKIPKDERYLHNLCYFCDNEPLKGLKVCQEHYDTIINAREVKLENEMEVFVERMNLAKYPTDTLDNMRDKLNLTEDEEEIFDLLAKAKTIKEISLEVGLSTRTVDNRIANIRSKMRQIGIVI